jgi:hypothetical protein
MGQGKEGIGLLLDPGKTRSENDPRDFRRGVGLSPGVRGYISGCCLGGVPVFSAVTAKGTNQSIAANRETRQGSGRVLGR